MNKKFYTEALTLAALLLLSSGILAQDKTEVSILVKKNGEVIKDTTYQFDSASDAENALKMMEIISEDEPLSGEFQYNYSMSRSEGNQKRAMVFISEDGDHTKITELEGDSLVWIGEDEDVGQADAKEKKIRVMVTDDEGGTWTIHEGGEDDEDGTSVIVIKKEVEKDQDVDLDQDVDVNVKVIKKKKIEKEEN